MSGAAVILTVIVIVLIGLALGVAATLERRRVRKVVGEHDVDPQD